MTYCKNTDGNLAALAQYEKEQDKLYREDDLDSMADDMMGDIDPGNTHCIAWEAIGNDGDTIEAICDMIRDYDEAEKITIDRMKYNHKLAAKVIKAVHAYCRDYAVINQ